MNIGLAIYGNLTGFARFYANEDAKTMLNNTKFNFDVHNSISFLNNGEKLYAIFFSKDLVAVCLITNILDSFRRPGNLVIAALIPSKYYVASVGDHNSKDAIYNLLNDVNARFYEKNFQDGMIKQNPALLMQDYYSDILANYTLESDRMQKAVNSAIDIAAPNKRIGYVAAKESDMPKYLSSLMRKSYNGYHYVFFAENAPQNIDEPAEEVVTYHVRIENGHRNVPGEVRLTDKIPAVAPQQGEKPLANTNFTYGQVLNGEAGPDIVGTIENETITLSFHFQREEKTVSFKFYDGSNELPIQVINPVIVDSDGASLPISSDSFTFYGKEIYGRKTIKSRNPEYTIDSADSVIDLQRYNNGSTITLSVRRGWGLNVNFPGASRPKTVTLTNTLTRESKSIENVGAAISRTFPGNISEWELEVKSEYYETVRVPAAQVGSNLILTSKRQDAVANVSGSKSNANTGGSKSNANVSGGGSEAKAHGNSGQKIKISGGTPRAVVGQTGKANFDYKRYLPYALLVAVPLIVWLLWPKGKPNPNDGDLITTEVAFDFWDSKKEALSDQEMGMLSLSVKSEDNVQISDSERTLDAVSQIRKIFNYPNGKAIKVGVSVSLQDNHDIVLYEGSVDISDKINIFLPIQKEALLAYADLNNNTKVSNIDKIIGRIQPPQEWKHKEKFIKCLKDLNSKVCTKDIDDSHSGEESRKEEEKVTSVKEAHVEADAHNEDDISSLVEKFDARFDLLCLVLNKDGNALLVNQKDKKPLDAETDKEKSRQEALIKVLMIFKKIKGDKLKSEDYQGLKRLDDKDILNNLSGDQNSIITDVITCYTKIESIDIPAKKQQFAKILWRCLKDCKSLSQVHDGMSDFKKDDSISKSKLFE